MPPIRGALPFVPNEDNDENRIVSDLLSSLKFPQPQMQKPSVTRAVTGTLSDALLNYSNILAGGQARQGPFAQEMQRLRIEHEADVRDNLRAERALNNQIRIGVAEGKLREMRDVRAEDRQAAREQQRREVEMDEYINRQIIERGAAEGAGDLSKVSREERIEMLRKSMGARTPAEVMEEFANSGLTDKFRVDDIKKLADGTYVPTLKSIENEKDEKAAINESRLIELAKEGVPPEQILDRAKALGVDDNTAKLIADMADAAINKQTVKAKVDSLTDQIDILGQMGDADLAADMLEIRALVEGQASYEEVADTYAQMVEEARLIVEEDPSQYPILKRNLVQLQSAIRVFMGYEMPDVTELQPPEADIPEGDSGEWKRAKHIKTPGRERLKKALPKMKLMEQGVR